jgi:hypothetical protein
MLFCNLYRCEVLLISLLVEPLTNADWPALFAVTSYYRGLAKRQSIPCTKWLLVSDRWNKNALVIHLLPDDCYI